MDVRFLSTHPLRGATSGCSLALMPSTNFYPRTPCGVRRFGISTKPWPKRISIHAPPAGCDHFPYFKDKPLKNFYPRTPCGVRRCFDINFSVDGPISIHAPPAGCDFRILANSCCLILFLSTHPLRGATFTTTDRNIRNLYFYPRTPCGVRLLIIKSSRRGCLFLSTHPLRGATNQS